MLDLPIRESSKIAECSPSVQAVENSDSAQARDSNSGARPTSGWIGALLDSAKGAENEGFAPPERHAPRNFRLE